MAEQVNALADLKRKGLARQISLSTSRPHNCPTQAITDIVCPHKPDKFMSVTGTGIGQQRATQQKNQQMPIKTYQASLFPLSTHISIGYMAQEPTKHLYNMDITRFPLS
jgi:hypothetical protein